MVQAILHHVKYDLSLIDAIDEPAISLPESPEIELWEEGTPEEVRAEAADLGNEWSEQDSIGNINMLRANDVYEGGTGPGKDFMIGLSDE